MLTIKSKRNMTRRTSAFAVIPAIAASIEFNGFSATSVASMALIFSAMVLTLRLSNVVAFCRFTISFSRGCRHFPGDWLSTAGEAVVLGVDGVATEAIDARP
jgi:hypothetical protein